MNEPNDLTGRVDALETQMRDVRHELTTARTEATAARALAAGADHDVSEVRAELRAHTSALNALRETQLEQGQDINELRTEMRAVDHKVTALDAKVNEGFTKMSIGMAQITALIKNSADPEPGTS